MQFPFITYVWCYELTTVSRQNNNIETIYVYASGASEKSSYSHSKTCYFFQTCRYNGMLVGLHVPTNFQMYR